MSDRYHENRIDGKAMADRLVADVAKQVATLKQTEHVIPGLAVVIVGDDPASKVYVGNKIKRAKEAGLNSIKCELPENCTQDELEQLIERLNNDVGVHGILVQLPLPKPLSEARVIELISAEKDVDGFHPQNVGRLVAGQHSLVPCTPLGCLIMLREHFHGEAALSGKHAVVIGRSNIVGKPLAQLLLQANCTVSIVHSRTRDIETLCRQADILIAAVGRPQLVEKNWVKPGAVVIDVGINAIESDGARKLVGDVDFASVSQVASAITPVPGGVGPMTIACLMQNTLNAARMQIQHSDPIRT
ncbi:bifunctional methylenetetrahydrofolate dehydrogenase/methenyltetrahydrofolate cyclohydrolase FolD [Marinomonas mediterranea]|uniref:bifunctional methylenetetrahydrofolate dehydrogenase/methenyltetrahydrofolate cyclohydrolase FolD n=1 Tax=Marinomonas mediterranea TaxID=119864 RepID=UPI002349C56A|nr:bifunctional methylenetetrahydrofolate dehydrogenase/methenyltetrahydrofolate cyclohydrolase FolD [Marinomonas mediterranea]WCN13706.1 bifunctional methylenetetrahydrofolate dehydrogenase/methenyltetrahydrofolate cyclohydrolase FolD [Marinomonas mediterranea]